jgi:hypothetical protein
MSCLSQHDSTYHTMEVLAHVSAPATKEEDIRAEKRLQSYLSFQPVRITNFTGSNTVHKQVTMLRHEKRHATSSVERPLKRLKPQAHSRNTSDTNKAESADILDRTNFNRLSTEYQTTNTASAALFVHTESSYKTVDHSWVTTKSSIVKLEMAQQKWKAAQIPTSNVEWSNEPELSSISDSQVENTQIAISMLQDGLETVPESQSSQMGEDSTNVNVNVSVETTHIVSTGSEMEMESTKATAHAESKSIAHEALHETLHSDDPPSSDSHFDDSKISVLPRVIRSPPPTESIMQSEGTGTFMTKTLQRVMTYTDLVERYKHMKEAREIQASERGYWKIDTSKWSHKRQFDFWTFLNNLVGNGRAGLATQCFRNVNDDGSDDHTTPDQLGTVRVYCWGELVMHIWLLCHLASGGTLKSKQSIWISAIDGQPLVYMP